MFKEKFYNSLTADQKAQAKSLLTEFDEIFISRWNGTFEVRTDSMILASYADDARSVKITVKDIEEIEGK